MLPVIACLAAFALLIVVAKTRPRALDLVVVGLPIATVVGHVNLSAADAFLPFAIAAIVMGRRRGMTPPGPRPAVISYGWPLYFTALSVAVLLGLFVRSLRGSEIDFGYGVLAVVKLWIVLAYFGVFAHYGVKLFRDGDRIALLWVRVSCIASTAGIAGVLLFSRGVETRLAMDYRATGGFDDPNLFASYLLISIALTFVAYLRGGLKHPYLVVALQTAAMLATGSRAAVPALAAGVLFALFLGRGREVLRRLVGWGTVLTGAALVVLWRFPELLGLGSLSRVVNASNSVEADVRFRLWSVAWRMFLDNPIIGVGIGQFRTASNGYADWVVENITHSSHLSLLAETGIIGYLLVMGLPLSILFRLTGRARAARDIVATWLLVGVAASLAVAWTLNLENSRMLWAFLGICFGYLTTARTAQPAEVEEAADGPRPSFPRRPSTRNR